MKNLRSSTPCLDSNLSSLTLSMVNLRHKTTNIKMAAISPNLPISLAMVSSFYYKGVTSTSDYLSIAPILPSHELSPTHRTMNLPSPHNTLVPDMMIGEGTS